MLRATTTLYLVLIYVYLCIPKCIPAHVSPEYFQSSRVPIKDFQGLLDVLTHRNDNPITPLSTPEVIKWYGYPSEIHQVVTEDGYFLTLHRIPYDKNGSPKSHPRPVVFLQHGLFSTSFEWFFNEQEKTLPLQLSDAGYDVWLGNTRGNAYCRSHKWLSTNNRTFWEFSVDELGKFDLPVSIDYILNLTGQRQLSYVGFSMGTTMFFVMMSHRPEYNDKVKVMVALAPVAYMGNATGLVRLLAPFAGTERFLKELLDTILNGEFLPLWLTERYQRNGARSCSRTYIAETLCSNMLFFFYGFDLPQLQVNQLPVFSGHLPSPTSTRALAHLGQFINAGHFREYDFGSSKNMVKYGNKVPPDYNLQNVKTPVALIYGPNDAVVNPVDVKRLGSELPNLILDMPVNFTLWNHIDFLLAKDANELLNKDIMKLLAYIQVCYLTIILDLIIEWAKI